MENRTNVSYLKNTKCADVYTESQTDYTLPEYQADVRKILFSEVVLRPSGRFAGGETVEVSGVAVYTVVYLDAEGDVSSVEFTSDYDYSVKCSSDSYKDSIADTRVANFAVRLVGPRKMSAKASLVGSVRLTECLEMSVSGDAFLSDMSPEVDTVSAKIRQSRPSSVTEREYAECITRLDGAIADEVKVVYCNCEAMVESVEQSEDSVSVKGKLRMIAVIKNADEPAYSVEKKIDFEESVEIEGVTASMHLAPDLQVSSLKPSINADEGGCEVVLSGIVELCVIAEGNQQVDLIRDGYLVDCPTDNSYEKFDYTSLIDVISVDESHSAEVGRTELDSEGLKDVVFLSATPRVEGIDVADGVARVYGDVRYSGVVSEMLDDSISYSGVKFSSPFEINVNINCQNSDKIHIEPVIHTSNVSASVDAEKVCVSCSLDGTLTLCEEKNLYVLSSMTRVMDDSESTDGARVTVYYPSADESLFSVAKRFRTPILKVAKDNDITESVFAADNPGGNLSGVKRLIIY